MRCGNRLGYVRKWLRPALQQNGRAVSERRQGRRDAAQDVELPFQGFTRDYRNEPGARTGADNAAGGQRLTLFAKTVGQPLEHVHRVA